MRIPNSRKPRTGHCRWGGGSSHVRYAKGETTSIDWSTDLYIHFIWGVEMLIAAESAEVSFHQAVALY